MVSIPAFGDNLSGLEGVAIEWVGERNLVGGELVADIVEHVKAPAVAVVVDALRDCHHRISHDISHQFSLKWLERHGVDCIL